MIHTNGILSLGSLALLLVVGIATGFGPFGNLPGAKIARLDESVKNAINQKYAHSALVSLVCTKVDLHKDSKDGDGNPYYKGIAQFLMQPDENVYVTVYDDGTLSWQLAPE